MKTPIQNCKLEFDIMNDLSTDLDKIIINKKESIK